MSAQKKRPAVLALADGTVFHGAAFGADGEAGGEVVFNTAMTGYQEILTDPSYKEQLVAMTFPEIGNVGVNREDVESRRPFVAGFIVKEYWDPPSSWRAEQSLGAYMREHGIVGIADIDTRALVRHLRTHGAQEGVISTVDLDPARVVAKAKERPDLVGRDLVREVTCAAAYDWNEPPWQLGGSSASSVPPSAAGRPFVIAYDFGIKFNILRSLVGSGCRARVVPATTTAAEVLAARPDGVFLSNGPGDPDAVPYARDNVAALIGKVPIFGICLGHQILGLALGGRTYKLKFGHHGANHPVMDMTTGKVEITSQNHGFAVDVDSLTGRASLTHMNLNDRTVEGLAHKSEPLFSVQYHPEASPGPHDARYLFRRFVELMARTQAEMPKRTDLKTILVIGSGPIVIGQACEFDYSGVQACKALREEGYRIVLINSNPATIMTDPEFADRTYIEPMTVEVLERIIAAERPQAILPTIGGQTALNLAIEVAEAGILERYGVELIGAKIPAIKKAEDRDLFKAAMERIGLDLPRSGYARSMAEAEAVRATIPLPLIIRPSRTLGGTGGNVATTDAEFDEYVRWGLEASPTHEVLVEESIAGWKEFELEVMRDGKDNVVIVCSIENFDPMGVHTGDSITVAPAQTLTDKEYQLMRNAAIDIIREIGVDTGGSNIQFGVHPENGRLVVIEMNPRVSRSSALASKATGFPIAKIAAKLAVGYTLDEIPNDITRETPACFEPTIDYVVTKIPRFTFEKFPQARDVLGPQMKSVGEAMAIGRTFKESLQKAMRSLEIGSHGFEPTALDPNDRAALCERLRIPNAERLWVIADAFRAGLPLTEIAELTRIDPWFLRNIEEILAVETDLRGLVGTPQGEFPLSPGASPPTIAAAKRMGFSDVRIATLTGTTEDIVRSSRTSVGLHAVYKTVDTCGAEFAAHTPYLYSSFDAEDESGVSTRKKIIILGGGPNRIGQGIEFDYCCVHAAFALKEDGFETIMVNCNPETVSTDYDTSDRLYFEPLTLEDVLAIVHRERPDGVIVQFGGQTPLKLAVPLARAGVPIIGTSPDSIDRAEDRERFDEVLQKLGLLRPENGIARSEAEAIAVAARIGYPVLVRPSYVLGGRAMEIIYEGHDLERYVRRAFAASPDRPLLIDRFLEDAVEVDVDAVSDGHDVVIGGLMEHIERAGVHSGDSACSLPPTSIDGEVQEEIRRQTVAMARELGVIGLMNVQYAVQKRRVFILEVNPRASRTVPFVSKAIGVPLAKIAARVMAGKTLAALGFTHEIVPRHVSVKEAVFPFLKFPGVDTVLGPEMKSTGEVMGIGDSFGSAFAKAEIAAGTVLPQSGTIFISVRLEERPGAREVARRLHALGFRLVATRGMASDIRAAGIPVESVNKVSEGSPHIVDALQAGTIAAVVNAPRPEAQELRDSFSIRRTALERKIPYFTTIAAAQAAAEAIAELKAGPLTVKPLQEYHGEMARAPRPKGS